MWFQRRYNGIIHLRVKQRAVAFVHVASHYRGGIHCPIESQHAIKMVQLMLQ